MSVFQREILNASDCCSNCFARQRREAVRPRTYEPDETYTERVRAQTSVEDVPGPVASDAGRLFCDCGAEKHHTRIWDDVDVDRSRFVELLVTLLRTLVAKGYRVDQRRVAEVARERYRATRAGSFAIPTGFQEQDPDRDRPASLNDVFATAVAAGVTDTASPTDAGAVAP